MYYQLLYKASVYLNTGMIWKSGNIEAANVGESIDFLLRFLTTFSRQIHGTPYFLSILTQAPKETGFTSIKKYKRVIYDKGKYARFLS